MSQFFLWTFLVITLLVRLPVRIISRHSDKDIWGIIDLVGMVASIICLIGGSACAMANGKIETWLFISCTVLFGGIGLLIMGILVWNYLNEKKNSTTPAPSKNKVFEENNEINFVDDICF